MDNAQEEILKSEEYLSRIIETVKASNKEVKDESKEVQSEVN